MAIGSNASEWVNPSVRPQHIQQLINGVGTLLEAKPESDDQILTTYLQTGITLRTWKFCTSTWGSSWITAHTTASPTWPY